MISTRDGGEGAGALVDVGAVFEGGGLQILRPHAGGKCDGRGGAGGVGCLGRGGPTGEPLLRERGRPSDWRALHAESRERWGRGRCVAGGEIVGEVGRDVGAGGDEGVVYVVGGEGRRGCRSWRVCRGRVWRFRSR